MARKPKPRLSAKKVASAIRDAQGFVSVAARNLGVSRVTIYNWLARSTTVQEALTDSREQHLDFAEGALAKQIREGNIAAIIFYLKTQGKHRGYVERVEQEQIGEVKVTVEYENEPIPE